MSLKSRRELLASIAPRYQRAGKKEKQALLDEFTAATGYHRNYAITLLLNSFTVDEGAPSRPRLRLRRRKYNPEVQAALITVWEASYRICSKRLVPFLPDIVASLERHGHLALTAETRDKLLSISPATVDRLLYEIRHGEKMGGASTTRPDRLIKNLVPLRTFSEWNERRPGFIEADLVAHSGGDTRSTSVSRAIRAYPYTL